MINFTGSQLCISLAPRQVWSCWPFLVNVLLFTHNSIIKSQPGAEIKILTFLVQVLRQAPCRYSFTEDTLGVDHARPFCYLVPLFLWSIKSATVVTFSSMFFALRNIWLCDVMSLLSYSFTVIQHWWDNCTCHNLVLSLFWNLQTVYASYIF